MPTEPPENPQIRRLQRMEASIEALNARIARLAIGLGVTLANRDEMARVMHEHQPHEHQWEELRGLLVLRYDIETSYVDQVGVNATYHIMLEAEQHLVREGFEPGADGIDLDRLFNVINCEPSLSSF